MKKIFSFALLIGILITLVLYRHDIVNYIIDNHIYNKEIVIHEANEYKLNYDFQYINEINDFYPKNSTDITDIFYTFLNNGWDNFTFYCHDDYDDCINDVALLASQSESLSHLNNFIHPYNSYKNIIVNYNNFGRVTIESQKLYDDETIDLIEQEVDKIYNDLIEDDMDIREKIKVIHDHIIEITEYDHERAEAIDLQYGDDYDYTYRSNMAYGPLIQNMAICSGYSDAMAIFLNRFGVPNLKVANDKHIWNLVYLDGEWLHLDLTWDDRYIINTDESILVHTYFLITTEELDDLNDQQHYFNKNIYLEGR